MKTAQSIFILLFALWLPGCGLFSGTDNGQDKGVQDLGQTDLYPCGLTNDDYEFARFTLVPGDAVVDLLPAYETDQVQVRVEGVSISSTYGSATFEEVALKDAPNLKQKYREFVVESEGIALDELDDSFSVHQVLLWTPTELANEIARKSGANCEPTFPFTREF